MCISWYIMTFFSYLMCSFQVRAYLPKITRTIRANVQFKEKIRKKCDNQPQYSSTVSEC